MEFNSGMILTFNKREILDKSILCDVGRYRRRPLGKPEKRT